MIDITDYGIGGHPWDKDPVSPPPDQVTICKEWIEEWIDRQDRINSQYHSYGLKHAVAAAKGQYVSNGAFIQAAIELDYRHRQCEGQNSPNACFNMSFRRLKKYLVSQLGQEAKTLPLDDSFKRIRDNNTIEDNGTHAEIVCHKRRKRYFVKHCHSGLRPPGILGIAEDVKQAEAYYRSGYEPIKRKQARAFAKYDADRYTYTIGGPDRLCGQRDYLSVVHYQKSARMIQTHPPCPRVKG